MLKGIFKMKTQRINLHDYEWIVLSVTTTGALLASIQGSALIIALPNIMTDLQAGFLTIMWVLLSYLLQWANQHGRKEFDFMRGDEDYKYKFGGVRRDVMRAKVSR